MLNFLGTIFTGQNLFYMFLIMDYVVNVLLVAHLFITHKNKGWIFVLVFLPFIGTIMYLVVDALPRNLSSLFGTLVLRVIIVFTILSLFTFLFFIFKNGLSAISLEFIFDSPRENMTKGGIFPAIAGTFYLTIIAILIAFPLGVLAAIYLSEYAKPAWLVRIVRLAINTLSAVPSVVYGLFGLAIFVIMFKLQVSILAGGITLAVLALPIIINASEEAIKVVPYEFREASLALGATKAETILKIVLPTALPNILTGVILSVGRVAGETAPIIFTAATFYTVGLPESVLEPCMALPFHIYALMSEGTYPDLQRPIAYGSAILLLILVLLVNFTAIVIRYKMRKGKKW